MLIRTKPVRAEPNVRSGVPSRLSRRTVKLAWAPVAPGKDTPAMTVSVKFDQNRKEERVNFGLVGSDAFFARPGDSTAGKIDALELNEALKALDEISK